jgi:DNA-binding CsgD family transcriptional regulator
MSDVLGLDRHMHEAYHLLLHESACTAVRISDRLGISRTQADNTLARLVTAGLVAHAPHDPREVVAVDPRRGLAPLIAQRQAALAADRRTLVRSQQAVAELAAAYAEHHGDDAPAPPPEHPRLVPRVSADPTGAGVRAEAPLRSTRSVRARIEGLLETSRSAVMCFLADRPSALALEVSADLVEKAIHRGVSIKAVYAGNILGDEAIRAQARRLVSLGASARAATSLPPAMMVVDRCAALVRSEADGQDAVMVHNRTLAAALASLFDHVWGDVAAPVRQGRTQPGTGQTATGHPAAGHTATGHPAAGHTATGHPATGHPATGHPATGHHGSGQPGSMPAGPVESGSAHPGFAHPGSAHLGFAQPGSAQPGAIHPGPLHADPLAGPGPVQPAAPRRDQPSSQERDLLRLLGQGLTDASAARQLGVSLRTVRRMMAELMARLDARSRFEAGIRAAERGWVGTDRRAKLRPGPFGAKVCRTTGPHRRQLGPASGS